MNFLASTQEHVSMSTCGFKPLTGYMQLHSQLGKYLIHQSAFHKLRNPQKTRPIRNYRDTTDRYTPVSPFHATLNCFQPIPMVKVYPKKQHS